MSDPEIRSFEHEGFAGEGVSTALGPLLAVIAGDPAARVEEGATLRRSFHRRSGRVEVAGLGPVLLKAHHVRRARERWLSLVRPSRARQEWEAARYLRKIGFPVAEPLAYGERRRGRWLEAAFFVASFVDGMVPLDDALPRRLPREARAELERSARWIRTLHDGDFDHRDLHAGNVLVGPAGERAWLLVDLHRARWGRRVGKAARREALARWLHSVSDAVGPGARARTLRAYAPELSAGDRRRWWSAVEREIARLERVRRKSRAKRCFLESSTYTRDVGAGWGGRRRDLPLRRIDDALREHDRALAKGDARVAKRARKARVTRHGDLVVKESVPFGLLGRGKDILAPGRHRAGYRNAHLLQVLGVSTARPLAWLRRDRRVFALYADLSTRERLDHRAHRIYGTSEREAQRRLRQGSADWLAHLHRRGIYHGDLKGVNVLVAEEDDGRLDFALIDTDRVRVFAGGVDHRRRIKNLAQLAASIPVSVTRTERLRWYRRYAAGAPGVALEGQVAKEVAAELAKKTLVVDAPIE